MQLLRALQLARKLDLNLEIHGAMHEKQTSAAEMGQ
jgi:hypothetical protein